MAGLVFIWDMKHLWPVCLIPASILLFAAGDQPWKDKKVAEWTEEDSKQVLTDSPWAKTAYPVINANSGRRGMNNGRGGNGGNGRQGGRGTGINLGGLGIPIGGRGGGGPMGSPGSGGGGSNGGSSGGRYPRQPGGDEAETTRPKNNDPQTLTLRWESAQPIQDAQLKVKNTDTPQIDSGHYAIVVSGLAPRFLNAEKPKAELKKDGKKIIKQSDYKVLRRDEGNMMVFLFPRSKEISNNDKRIEFHAVIGQMEIRETFYVADMVYNGKLEL